MNWQSPQKKKGFSIRLPLFLPLYIVFVEREKKGKGKGKEMKKKKSHVCGFVRTSEVHSYKGGFP